MRVIAKVCAWSLSSSETLKTVVLNTLFKMTAPNELRINNLMIVQGEPRIFAQAILSHFLEHRRDVTLRRCRYELAKAKSRAHLLEGFEKALNHIDDVIRVIRASERRGSAQRLNEQLSALRGAIQSDPRHAPPPTQMERSEVEEELTALRAEIARLLHLIENEDALKALIREELV